MKKDNFDNVLDSIMLAMQKEEPTISLNKPNIDQFFNNKSSELSSKIEVPVIQNSNNNGLHDLRTRDSFVEHIIIYWLNGAQGKTYLKSVFSQMILEWLEINKETVIKAVVNESFVVELEKTVLQKIPQSKEVLVILEKIITKNITKEEIIKLFEIAIKDTLTNKLLK